MVDRFRGHRQGVRGRFLPKGEARHAVTPTKCRAESETRHFVAASDLINIAGSIGTGLFVLGGVFASLGIVLRCAVWLFS